VQGRRAQEGKKGQRGERDSGKQEQWGIVLLGSREKLRPGASGFPPNARPTTGISFRFIFARLYPYCTLLRARLPGLA
jgi:hypothetical protein